MRLAIVAPHYPEYSIRYAAAMSRHCEVLACVDEKQLSDEYEGRSGVDPAAAFVKPVRFRTPLDLVKLIVTIIRHRPSLVHLQEAAGMRRGLFTACVATLLKPFAVIVLTVHDPVAHEGRDSAVGRRAAGVQKYLRWLADVVVLHGAYCAAQYRRHRWATRQHIVVSRHGVVLEPAEISPVPAGPLKIYTFGRMETYKGLAVLVDAAERMHHDGLRFELSVAGRGPEMDRLESRLRRLPEVTVFNGYVPPMAVINSIQASDCVVLPYLEATQSGVLAAGFGGGRCVVASDTGGIPDVVEHMRNGLLVRPGDPDALVSAVRGLVADHDLRLTLQRGAAESARGALNWNNITDVVFEEFALHRRSGHGWWRVRSGAGTGDAMRAGQAPGSVGRSSPRATSGDG